MATVLQQVTQNIEQIDSADLLVGILADLGPDEIATVLEGLGTLSGNPRIVILQHPAASNSAPANSEVPSRLPAQNGSLLLVPWALPDSSVSPTPMERTLTAYESIFAAGEKLGVQGCCIIASKLENARSKWICQLTEPLLDEGVDLVAPCYARRKFEGLLNHSVISPLTRSLYGKRIQNPMGPDLGVSRRLFQQVLAADQNVKAGGGMHLLASLAPLAFCGDFQVCQANLGARIYPPPDWTNVSSLLSEILGPVFLAMERNAACWQRTRSSSQIKALDEPAPVSQTTGTIEIGGMINSFQLGARDLQEIWRFVLPPATLFELGKLSRLAPEQFRIPDGLWVRIIYDFALAHRLRTVNRDHLLRSLTPLYLGWVASYAREMETAGTAAVEQRLERLSLAYEVEKPYLVSRWRWPDRFNA